MLKGKIPFRRNSLMGNIWGISIGYWGSRERIFVRYGLAALLIGLTFFQTYCYTLSNAAMSNYAEVIQNRDGAHWVSAMLRNFFVESFVVTFGAVVTFVTALLSLLWRSWFTKDMIKKWIEKNSFYKIERFENLDNPDQRIAEDCNQFTSKTIDLSFGLVGTLSSLVTFSYIAITKGGPLDLWYHGHDYRVPGGTFMLSFLWSMLATIVTVAFGKNLLNYTINLQHREASFRFSTAMVRKYSEQIALIRGNTAEIARLDKDFDDAFLSNLKMYLFHLKFTPVTGIISWLTGIVIDVFLMPRYFSGGITFSDMMRVSGSVTMISHSMMWIANNFSGIQNYRAVVTRVSEMNAAIKAADAVVTTVRGTRSISDLIVEGVSVNLPNGDTLINDATFSVRRGDRIWVKGASGAGKSTLFRALAGIWPYSDGEINAPEGSAIAMLPQESYMPRGTLKAALVYPDDQETVSDQDCEEALALFDLWELSFRLHETEKWQDVLSPGQRQRIALIRILLKKPDFVFLDEATSALDMENEAKIYHIFRERLSNSGIISISHRVEPTQFYDHILELSDRTVTEKTLTYGNV
ncbi:ABC transporter ATP-binding protein/permease [Acetobacter sacchari]|uniref:ABC transporter ATP-binding protein/permease n=1 Tax=Acetobacter sacchari TaxID=2661687 RepID=A0ABS3LXB6_9PROT|nr:ATP-binding cassette domain-containing protein [Acetobacter sacchari]MBO1360570.1 ABC transporter ATP-binding protein/permease [Acetobacter sacchari]